MTDQPITCRAAVLFEEGLPMTIEDVIIPAPKDDQVRIKMVSAGICASDGHLAWGNQKIAEFPSHTVPAVLGHEGAGIVESVGPEVKNLKVGDHVLTTFAPQCKQCPTCVNSLTNLCVRDNFGTLAQLPTKSLAKTGQQLCNFTGLGIYSEYAVMRESQAIKIANEANLEHACVISCAVATGFYSATNQAKVKPGSICAVWGIGAIGLNALQGCKFNGAAHILAIDINPEKKDIALRYGATQFINPKDLDKPLEKYLQETYSGIHYAFDCFGSQQVVDQALKSLASFGTFAMVGIAKAGTNIVYPTFDLLLGRKIVGGIMGQKTSEEAFTELTNLYVSGKYDVDGLITNKFKLEQINEAFQTLRDGKCVRSIIVF